MRAVHSVEIELARASRPKPGREAVGAAEVAGLGDLPGYVDRGAQKVLVSRGPGALSLPRGNNEQPFRYQIIEQARERRGARRCASQARALRTRLSTRREPVNGGGTRRSPDRTKVSLVDRVS